MATKMLTRLRVTHVYDLELRLGEVSASFMAQLIENGLMAYDPNVYGPGDTDFGIGSGADFGTSKNVSADVEVL